MLPIHPALNAHFVMSLPAMTFGDSSASAERAG